MSRVRKLALAAGAWATLAVGAGCGMLDNYDDPYDSPPPAEKSAGLPPPMEGGAQPAGGQQPGVYTDTRR